jgi:hypothetical protein
MDLREIRTVQPIGNQSNWVRKGRWVSVGWGNGHVGKTWLGILQKSLCIRMTQVPDQLWSMRAYRTETWYKSRDYIVVRTRASHLGHLGGG